MKKEVLNHEWVYYTIFITSLLRDVKSYYQPKKSELKQK